MIPKSALRGVALVVIFGSLAAHAQATAEGQNAEQMKGLVVGRTWALSFQGNLSNLHTVTYWDFKADGSVCARFAGSKPGDKCADDGTWQLKGEVLCWNLQRIGETYAYKSVCVRARKVDEKRYEAIAQDGYKMAPAAFFPIK